MGSAIPFMTAAVPFATYCSDTPKCIMIQGLHPPALTRMHLEASQVVGLVCTSANYVGRRA